MKAPGKVRMGFWRGLLALVLAAAMWSVAFAALLGIFLSYGGPWALAIAEVASAGALHAEGVRGGLVNQLSIRRLVLTTEDNEVTITGADLRWRPRALLQRELYLERLAADTVDVVLKPKPDTPFKPLPDRLPLTLVLDAAAVRELRVRQPDESLLELSGIAASLRWDGEGLTLHRAAVVYPLVGAVGAAGFVKIEGDALHFRPLAIAGPAQLNVQGTLGLDRRASDLAVRGDRVQWPLQGAPQVVAENFRLRFAGRPEAAQLSARTRLLAVVPEGLGAAAPATPAEKAGARRATTRRGAGRAAAATPGARTKTTTVTTATGTKGRSSSTAAKRAGTVAPLGFSVELDALLGEGSVKLETFRIVSEKAGQGTVSGKANVAWAPALRADGALVIENLDPGLVLPDWQGRLNGKATLSTAPVPAAKGGGTVPEARFDLAFARSQLRSRRFELDLVGRYQQGMPPVMAAAPAAAASAANAAPGMTVAGARPSTSAATASPAGRPAARAPAASAFPPSDAVLSIKKLRLASGSVVLTAQGEVLPRWRADAALAAGNLADLVPGVAGSARARLDLVGPLKRPRVKADASASDLRYGDVRVAAATLVAALDPDLKARSTATLDARGVQLGADRQLDTLAVALDGRVGAHRLSFVTTAPEGRIATRLAGAADLDRRSWTGTLDELMVDATSAPQISLVAPARLQLSAERQALEDACLVSPAGAKARLCLGGERTAAAAKARFTLRDFDLATLQPLMPKGLLLDATAEGEGRVELRGTELADAVVDLKIGAGRIVAPEPAPPLALVGATFSLLPQGGNWALQSRIETDRARVEAVLTVPRAGNDWLGKALGGRLVLDVPSIAFLQTFAPQVEGLEGRADGALTLAGTVGAPRFAGELRLRDARLRVPAAGLALTGIAATVTGTEAGDLRLAAQLTSGEGTLQLAGTARLAPEGLTASVTARGENLKVADIADARVWASPDLKLDYTPAGATLTGRVVVPRARITPRRLASGAVAPSRDTVVVGREAPEAKPLPVSATVTLVLGEDVRFEGFGLKARFEGEVTARDDPGLATTRGRGEIRIVEGRYQAYGQDLKLEYGRLLFAGGPITEPTLDFRAVRQLREDFSVAANIRGTLDQPTLELSSSDSSLTREEQLAWLVLGRPLPTASGNEQAQITAAAASRSLGLVGGDFLLGKLGKSLGLDEVNVGAAAGEDEQTARVTIGKYLTPKLYVSYGYGVFDRANNVFRVLYDLGRGFKVRVETGLKSGGDLLYTVER